MKKVLIKKLVVAMIIVTIALLHSKVFATGGQANGINGSVYENTVSYFFELVRSMETESGTLGKASNINTNNYVDSSGNGIDCHLEKNTEYGTITLLAASQFGNSTSNDTTSTGANNTGVFQMSNGKAEYVATTLQESESSAKYSNSYNKALTNADSRYVDEYKSLTKYSIVVLWWCVAMDFKGLIVFCKKSYKFEKYVYEMIFSKSSHFCILNYYKLRKFNSINHRKNHKQIAENH